MGNRFEWSWVQSTSLEWPSWIRQALGISAWVPPQAELETLALRPLSTPLVMATEVVPWPQELRYVPLTLRNQGRVSNGYLPGEPVQRVSNVETVLFTEINPWQGNAIRKVSIPLPEAGDFWVRGNPTVGGMFDRHWVGVEPSGRVHEVIGMNKHARTVMAYSVWENNSLVSGYACNAARVSASAHLWHRKDRPHRVAIVLNEYAGWDGKRDWDFPRCGDWIALKPEILPRLGELDSEQSSLVSSLISHGAIILDKSGLAEPKATLSMVAGADWAGSTLEKLYISMSDFVRVIQ